MTVTTKYDLRQHVYLIHDPDQILRVVVEINIITKSVHSYLVRSGSDENWHYEFELSNEKNNNFL